MLLMQIVFTSALKKFLALGFLTLSHLIIFGEIHKSAEKGDIQKISSFYSILYCCVWYAVFPRYQIDFP